MSSEYSHDTSRRCLWCQAFLPPACRLDTRTCSKRCRQARARFAQAVTARAQDAQPLRLAYADPPYVGKSHRYRNHPDYSGEVNHAELVSRLVRYDGWALSASATSIPLICRLLNGIEGWRIASWHRGPSTGRVTRGPHSTWEPVFYKPARLSQEHARDSYQGCPRARTTDPAYVVGAKPPGFCNWLFSELLQAAQRDSFTDLYPGSGGVTRAWAIFTGAPNESSPA